MSQTGNIISATCIKILKIKYMAFNSELKSNPTYWCLGCLCMENNKGDVLF